MILYVHLNIPSWSGEIVICTLELSVLVLSQQMSFQEMHSLYLNVAKTHCSFGLMCVELVCGFISKLYSQFCGTGWAHDAELEVQSQSRHKPEF